MVTQFARPCLLSAFWHIFCHSGPPRSLTSGCPRLPSEQTLTVSHFFCQKAESVPSGLMSPISQPVSPLSRPTSQCTCPTLVSQVTGNNGGRSERQKLKLFGGADGQLVTQDVLMSISGEIDWWELYNTKNKHTRRQKLQLGPASDDSWIMINQGLVGAPPESFHCSPERWAGGILSIHFSSALYCSLQGK